jgi:hypothetical protein
VEIWDQGKGMPFNSHERIGELRLSLEKALKERRQLIDALASFFSEYDSDSEYSYCAPTDETEAKMRAAISIAEEPS